ncbi:hypothetical protein MMC31_006807 [Peltigera leucophlebia]|nr:hypothetical protein [Peltigera leucophlebia]
MAHELTRETAIRNLDGRLNEPVLEVKRKINSQYLDQEAGYNLKHREAGASNSEQARQDIQWIRLTSRCMKENILVNQASCEFSPGFLSDMSIAFANKREIAHSDFELSSSINFSSAQSSRNKLHVACAVTMILQRQQIAITKHDFDLPIWPQNERQFHAARYRRNQLQILNYGIDSLLSYLRELTGLKELAGGDVRTVRLEHILTDHSQGILTDFRAALNAGLGTRNAAKIRKNRWVECAFSLWLCGLWVHAHRGGASCLSNPTCKTLRWLNFLRMVYMFPIEPGPHEGQSGIEGDHDASDDTLLLCESFMTVIQAAVKKNPRSLYGDSGVTTARLAWCVNIIREEGVMCPNLDGKTGEDDDEYVLFLEDRSI